MKIDRFFQAMGILRQPRGASRVCTDLDNPERVKLYCTHMMSSDVRELQENGFCCTMFATATPFEIEVYIQDFEKD